MIRKVLWERAVYKVPNSSHCLLPLPPDGAGASPNPKHSSPINYLSHEHVSAHWHHTLEELWGQGAWNQTFNEVQSVFMGPAGSVLGVLIFLPFHGEVSSNGNAGAFLTPNVHRSTWIINFFKGPEQLWHSWEMKKCCGLLSSLSKPLQLCFPSLFLFLSLQLPNTFWLETERCTSLLCRCLRVLERQPSARSKAHALQAPLWLSWARTLDPHPAQNAPTGALATPQRVRSSLLQPRPLPHDWAWHPGNIASLKEPSVHLFLIFRPRGEDLGASSLSGKWSQEALWGGRNVGEEGGETKVHWRAGDRRDSGAIPPGPSERSEELALEPSHQGRWAVQLPFLWSKVTPRSEDGLWQRD